VETKRLRVVRALVEKMANPPVEREPVIEVTYEVENSPPTWRIPGPNWKLEVKVPSAASREELMETCPPKFAPRAISEFPFTRREFVIVAPPPPT
jgi:hypothetical protein